MNKAALIRIDEELLAKVDTAAKHEGRSRNNFINYVLRQWCDADAVTIENARLVDPGVAYEAEATDD